MIISHPNRLHPTSFASQNIHPLSYLCYFYKNNHLIFFLTIHCKVTESKAPLHYSSSLTSSPLYPNLGKILAAWPSS